MLSYDPNVGLDGQTTVTALNVPPTGYNVWAAGYGITVGTETNDNDGDLVDNIHEYGAGGDPNDPLDKGYEPVFTNTTGSMEYLYAQRTDDANLAYYLETTTDLATVPWADSGYSELGTYVTGGDFDVVTNSSPTTADQTFSRLIVEYP